MSRPKRTVSEWRALIADQVESGQTQEEWCIAKGVNLYTYRDRVSRLKKLDNEGSNKSTLFVQTKRRIKNEPADTEQAKNTEQTRWVEVKPEVERQAETASTSNGKLIIEVGLLRMTANASFPMVALATLLREMMAPC